MKTKHIPFCERPMSDEETEIYNALVKEETHQEYDDSLFILSRDHEEDHDPDDWE